MLDLSRDAVRWLGITAVFAVFAGCSQTGTVTGDDLPGRTHTLQTQAQAQAQAEGTDYRFEQVVEAARQAAENNNGSLDTPGQLHEASAALPPALAEMQYDGFMDIGFDPDHAEPLSGKAGYSLQGFHRGWLYHDPVHISLVSQGKARNWAYEPDAFSFGKHAPQPDGSWGDLGWAGLKINRPWEVGGADSELLVMLGASYFRALGEDSRYGASGRLVAVNTGIPGVGESFPRVTSVWIYKQTSRDEPLRIDCYLADEYLTGACSLTIHPGKTTAIDVDLHLFIRKPIQKLGLAPITSMFMFGQEPDNRFRDMRPEVHDNDALLVHSKQQTYFQPLRNPLADRTYRLDPPEMTGFGLIQRERRFDRYLDPITRHELRPDVYVTPRNDWPEGAVEVLELARIEEKVDNIGCYYAIDDVQAGAAIHAKYTVAFGTPIAELASQRVDYTEDAADRPAADGEHDLVPSPEVATLEPGHLAQAQYVVFAHTPWPHWSIIFDGPALREMEPGSYFPCVCIDAHGEHVTPVVIGLPDGRWQVDLSDDLAYPVDIRFEHDGQPLTETVRIQEPIR